MDKRLSCANCSSTDHHVSACPTYKQGMKAIGFGLVVEDASEVDHEDFMRGVIAKFGPRCSFCKMEGHNVVKKTVHNFGMLWQKSSIQCIRKRYWV